MSKFARYSIPIILLLALFLRLLNITQLRLTHDEMSIGYNAYSILKTGKDEWGQTFPLIFRAFGDQKLPTYIYATVPSIALLGLNSTAVKLPSIIAGIALVFGVYKLTKVLFNHERLAWLAGLLVAINPWPIHLSRLGLESNLALVCFVFGLLQFLQIVERSKEKKQVSYSQYLKPISLLSLAAYTYIAYRLYIPLLLLTAIGWSLIRPNKLKPSLKAPLIILVGFALFISPFFMQVGGSNNTSRLNQLAGDNFKGAQALSTDQNNFCFLVQPKILPSICRVIYHPSVNLIKDFALNYATFISPDFTFLKGDKLAYLSLPHFPDIYTWLLPFYWLGSIVWIQKKHAKFPIITWGWLLAPIPAAISGEPQIVRGSALIPFMFIFISLGLWGSWQYIRHWANIWNKSFIGKLGFWGIIGVMIMLIGVSISRFIIQYYLIYPHQQRASFYLLDGQVAANLVSDQDKYENIYITTDIPDAHIALAFYGQIDPSWYQANVVRPEADNYNFQHPTRLGKFEFGPRIGEVINEPFASHWLYVTSATEETYSTQIFKDYSGVHGEIKILDVDLGRAQLQLPNPSTTQ